MLFECHLCCLVEPCDSLASPVSVRVPGREQPAPAPPPSMFKSSTSLSLSSPPREKVDVGGLAPRLRNDALPQVGAKVGALPIDTQHSTPHLERLTNGGGDQRGRQSVVIVVRDLHFRCVCVLYSACSFEFDFC